MAGSQCRCTLSLCCLAGNWYVPCPCAAWLKASVDVPYPCTAWLELGALEGWTSVDVLPLPFPLPCFIFFTLSSEAASFVWLALFSSALVSLATFLVSCFLSDHHHLLMYLCLASSSGWNADRSCVDGIFSISFQRFPWFFTKSQRVLAYHNVHCFWASSPSW